MATLFPRQVFDLGRYDFMHIWNTSHVPASDPPDAVDNAWGMFKTSSAFKTYSSLLSSCRKTSSSSIIHPSLKTSRIFPVSSPNSNFVITEIEKRLGHTIK